MARIPRFYRRFAAQQLPLGPLLMPPYVSRSPGYIRAARYGAPRRRFWNERKLDASPG